jgi:hypothetical protein
MLGSWGADASTYGAIQFYQANSTGTINRTGMTLNSSGNLQAVGSISVGNATPTTSGAGITFPATQSASTNANTLDDYEEGTWSPSVTNMTTTGSPAYAGVYTKIGNLVTVNFYTTSGAGTTYASTANSTLVAGFPFATRSTNTAFQPWPGSCANGNTTAGGTVSGNAGAASAYFFTTLSASVGISFTITYLV